MLLLSFDVGILFIDVSNPYSCSVISYWNSKIEITGNLVGVMITNDNKFAIGSIRG